MQYTVRFAHLVKVPSLKVGNTVKRGDIVGIMGSSGQSTAPHVHIDVVEGKRAERYTLNDIELNKPKAAPPRQLLYFVDVELFGVEPVVTTYYADPDYFVEYHKVHFGFDVVPFDRHSTQDHFNIKWPRSMVGKVVAVDYDANGYGHCISISYEV